MGGGASGEGINRGRAVWELVDDDPPIYELMGWDLPGRMRTAVRSHLVPHSRSLSWTLNSRSKAATVGMCAARIQSISSPTA